MSICIRQSTAINRVTCTKIAKIASFDYLMAFPTIPFSLFFIVWARAHFFSSYELRISRITKHHSDRSWKRNRQIQHVAIFRRVFVQAIFRRYFFALNLVCTRLKNRYRPHNRAFKPRNFRAHFFVWSHFFVSALFKMNTISSQFQSAFCFYYVSAVSIRAAATAK